MPQTLIVGDIHGCYFELLALLDKAGLGAEDLIIGIGDIVDRGPESPQVLEYFQKTAHARAVMGNHERKHVRAARHEVKLSISQHITQAQLAAAYQDALAGCLACRFISTSPDAIVSTGTLSRIELENQNLRFVRHHGRREDPRAALRSPWYELYETGKPIIVGHKNYIRAQTNPLSTRIKSGLIRLRHR
jgi:serine/threonine protein phosphatase 1